MDGRTDEGYSYIRLPLRGGRLKIDTAVVKSLHYLRQIKVHTYTLNEKNKNKKSRPLKTFWCRGTPPCFPAIFSICFPISFFFFFFCSKVAMNFHLGTVHILARRLVLCLLCFISVIFISILSIRITKITSHFGTLLL